MWVRVAYSPDSEFTFLSKENTYLVVGGDSLVGGGLMRALERRGLPALTTTRRPGQVTDQKILLDFENPKTFSVPDSVDYAFVVAAATNYDRCEADPLAYTINVELIPRLVETLLEQGVFVAFVSTNSVFGGEQPWPHEYAPHEPGIAYAKQKSQGEQHIRSTAERLDATDRLAIVRLTKILERSTSPIPSWIETWERGEVVHPFADLIFAPMSVHFVGEALVSVGESRAAGHLHLSGSENVDYVAFAKAIADETGVDHALIGRTTASDKGVHIAFKPTYSGLGMERTTALTGLVPQPLMSAIRDIFSN